MKKKRSTNEDENLKFVMIYYGILESLPISKIIVKYIKRE